MKVKLWKYITFSLISNYIIFNTLADCCKGKNTNKKGKGCSGSGKDKGKDTTIINNEQQEQNSEDLNKKDKKDEEDKNPKEELIDESKKENYKKLIKENDNIIQYVKSLLGDFIKENEIYEYSISKNIKDIKNKLNNNKATCKDIKKIKEINDLVKKGNLINLIKEKFTNKLKQYDITKDENKDINILNCLLTCTLFKKKINDSELSKSISDDDEIKKGILDLYEGQMSYYKAQMDENKVYISYDSDDNKNNYIFAKTGESFIGGPYKVKNEMIYEEKDVSGKFINENMSACIQFNKDTFNKIFKKNGKEYKDIILLTNNEKYSYLCYCRPDNFSFHIVHVDDNSFHGLFSHYSAKEITILYNSPNITSTKYMFYYCTNLTELDLSKFNTSNVTDMKNMFSDCENLKNITFGDNFNTSNVTNMSSMFYWCTKLEKLDLSKFDTSKVIYMSSMFYTCEKLEELDLSNFDISNVTDMGFMFIGCKKLKNITFWNNFHTSKVTNMSSMFYTCEKLEELDLSNFDTSKVIYMSSMFSGCENLKKITFGNNFNTSKVTNMYAMFQFCRNLEELDLSNFNTTNVTNMEMMFYYCKKLKKIILGENFNLNSLTNCKDIFKGCEVLNEDSENKIIEIMTKFQKNDIVRNYFKRHNV